MNEADSDTAVGCRVLVTVNALTLLRAADDDEYAAALIRADEAVADGIGCAWAVRRLTGRRPRRLPGIDLIEGVAAAAARTRGGVYCLGGRPGVARAAAEALVRRHPGLRLCGAADGYFDRASEATRVEAVNASGADVLLVGLGQPAQEFFLDRHRGALQCRFALGVGGSFDVLAGRLRRAPRWLQRIGGEWLFRMLQEPRRFVHVIPLLRFVMLVWRAGGRGRKRSRGS